VVGGPAETTDNLPVRLGVLTRDKQWIFLAHSGHKLFSTYPLRYSRLFFILKAYPSCASAFCPLRDRSLLLLLVAALGFVLQH